MRYVTAIAAALIVSALSVHSQLSVPGAEALPEIADAILSQPAVSPDGTTLAFVHDGDIWTVPVGGGTARRLTITVDNDGDPQFSPDGRSIAFRSRRYGNDDIFVMPAEGGKARRLTFADSADQPDCWLPDGSGIIFSSYQREGGRDLWVVRADGGEPWPITGGGFGVNEQDATISPNGKLIAYCTSGGDPARRRGYLGHADGDIWLCDFDGRKTGNHRRITENNSHDASPVFTSDNELLFITFANAKTGSDRVGRIAQYHMKRKSITEPGDQRALDPKQLAWGSGIVAFSSGNYGGWKLHVWMTTAAHPFRIQVPDIRLDTDTRRAELQGATLTTADQLAPSPDGKKLAFIAGGDVFIMPADETGVPYQLTDTTGPEVSVTWAPDSAHVAWVDQLKGTIHIADLREFADAGAKVRALPPLNRTSTFSRPAFDANGNLWAIGDERRLEFVTRDEAWGAKGDAPPALELPGNFHGASLGGGQAFEFSPDGKWIVYEQSNALYDEVVMLAEVATRKTQSISHLFGSASAPRFSADGKRVVFINDQEGEYDVYTVDLAPQAPEFKEDKLEKLFKKPGKDDPAAPGKDDPAEPGAEAPGNEKDDKPEAKDDKPKRSERKKPDTKVVFEGLKDRIKRITTLDGHEFAPLALADGKTYVFIGNSQEQSNIWKLVLDPDKGPDLKQLTQSRTAKSSLTISADEKNLWWLDAGAITSMPVAGGKISTYAFRVEQRRNRDQLRATAFDQAAWVMGNYYYDRAHHGINWMETANRYKRALGAVSTGDEYDALMDDMLGELNSSHQGFTGADLRSDDFTESTGCLGLLFDPLELSEGRYRITEVVTRGPCELPEGGPAVGEYLVAINGAALAKVGNMADLLVSTIGRKTILSLNGAPVAEGARRVAVKPISRIEESRLFYARWVGLQRDMVEKLSNGRLGYVHIAAMDDRSLREFKHELGDEMLGKEGVVIDVRYNGGGSTAVDILEILYKKTWLKRQWGGLDEVSENIYRSVALEKPSVLLINQASFSNAEIMAEGFRKLEIGKIVGVDTAGGVIGTGSFRLIDGSRMRLPSTGAYTIDGENLELAGRKPDLFVENQPEELDKGIDRQTETAVKTLLAQIDRK
jgi:tricorn protease